MFNDLFLTEEHDLANEARQYLSGLSLAKRKNMERMEEVVEDVNYGRLRHFISEAPWDHRAVMDRIAQLANDSLGDKNDTCLIIDETYFGKKGDKSVGVARQWNGRLGKVDNCQVAVSASLCKGKLSTLVDTRLYLPKHWSKDALRCISSGIPLAERSYKSKSTIALEMVRRARGLGLEFGWVDVDGGYGKDPKFPRELEDIGEIFFADVHKDQRVYLEYPAPYLPEYSGRGARPKHFKTDLKATRVDQLTKSFSNHKWCAEKTRDATKGPVVYDFASQEIWVWDGREKEARKWLLIARRDAKTNDNYKYTFTNAPATTSLQRLGYCMGQRFWIENDFKNGKSNVGLGDYQVRAWLAWQHHMALVMMSLIFILRQRIEHQDEFPLLSCADLVELLCAVLPQRNRDVDEAISQLNRRHAKRRSAIDSAYRSKGFEPPGEE